MTQPARQTAQARTTKSGYTPGEVRQGMLRILVGWGFGASFFALVGGTPLAAFLTKYLHVDDFTFGLISTSGALVVFFTLFGSYVTERTGRTKRNFLIFGSLHRLFWLGVAAVPLVIPEAPKEVKAWVTGAFIVLSAAAGTYGGAGWAAWVAGIIPKSLAGKFFGYRHQLGLVAMIVVSTLATYALDWWHNAGWAFALVFAVAAALGVTDILQFIHVREVPKPVSHPPSMRDIITTPWRNHLFRSFALYSFVTWAAYGIMAPFVARYCLDDLANRGLGMSNFWVNILLSTIPVVCMAIMAPFWGQAIDRFGPKPVLAASSLAHVILPFAWVLISPNLIGVAYLIAALGGLAWPGVEQIVLYVQVKVFPVERRTAYNAMYAIVLNIGLLAGGLLGGVLARVFDAHFLAWAWVPAWMSHYQLVFLVSAVLRVLSFVIFMPRVPLEGAGTHSTVARAVAGGALTALPNMVGKRRRVGK